jgi:hypothetical protein
MTKEDERPGARLGEMDANAVRLDRPVCDLRQRSPVPFNLLVAGKGDSKARRPQGRPLDRVRYRFAAALILGLIC